eukprot:Opistho-2@75787
MPLGFDSKKKKQAQDAPQQPRQSPKPQKKKGSVKDKSTEDHEREKRKASLAQSRSVSSSLEDIIEAQLSLQNPHPSTSKRSSATSSPTSHHSREKSQTDSPVPVRPSEGIDVLEVRVFGARGLNATADTSVFAEVRLQQDVFYTSTKEDGRNPRWDERFNFVVHDSDGWLSITLKDASKGGSAIGRTVVSVAATLQQLQQQPSGQQGEGTWFVIEGTPGAELKLAFRATTEQAMTQQCAGMASSANGTPSNGATSGGAEALHDSTADSQDGQGSPVPTRLFNRSVRGSIHKRSITPDSATLRRWNSIGGKHSEQLESVLSQLNGQNAQNGQNAAGSTPTPTIAPVEGDGDTVSPMPYRETVERGPPSPALSSSTPLVFANPTPPADPSPHGEHGSLRNRRRPSISARIPKLFLQVDDEVRKTSTMGPLTRQGIRYAFLGAFPEVEFPEPFPKAYARDPQAGVFYELEDFSEIGENAVLRVRTGRLTLPSSMAHRTTVDLGASGTLIGSVSTASDSGRLDAIERRLGELFQLLTGNAAGTQQDLGAPGKIRTRAPSSLGIPLVSPVLLHVSGPLSPVISDSAADVEQSMRRANEQTRKLRRDLARMRDEFIEQRAEFIKAIDACQLQIKERMESIVSGTPSGVVMPRVRLTATRERLSKSFGSVEARVGLMEQRVNTLTRDVVSRHCKLRQSELEIMSSEIDGLRGELSACKEMYASLKGGMKGVWEKELKNVVAEETFIKETGEDIEDIEDAFEQLTGTAATLQKLVAVQETLPPLNVDFGVEDLSARDDTVQDMLDDIRGTFVDNAARLRQIENAERYRRATLQMERENGPLAQFEKSLRTFSKKLRPTGGIDSVEARRREKDSEVLKAVLLS